MDDTAATSRRGNGCRMETPDLGTVLADVWPLIPVVTLIAYAPIWRRRYVERRRRDYGHERGDT